MTQNHCGETRTITIITTTPIIQITAGKAETTSKIGETKIETNNGKTEITIITEAINQITETEEETEMAISRIDMIMPAKLRKTKTKLCNTKY